MTPSEENFTAWVDGRLSREEAARFEEALGDALPEVGRDREEARKLGNLLRTQWKPAELTNGDFFNHQLLERIQAEESRTRPPSEPARHGVSLWRLLWIGSVCCGIAVMATMAVQPVEHGGARGYYAQVLNPKPGNSKISAKPFYSRKANVTVLWLDGLDRVSGEGRK